MGTAELVLLAIVTSPTHGTVWFVDDSATGAGDGTSWVDAFPYLQDALGVAQAGDELWIAEGTYRPDLGAGRNPLDRTEQFELVPGVSLYGGFLGIESNRDERGGRADDTVLTGDLLGDDGPDFSNRSDNSERVVEARGPGEAVRIEGLRIEGGASPGRPGGGLRVDFLDVTLQDVGFARNSANVGGGLHAHDALIVLSGCSFEDCRAAVSGGAMYLDRLTGATVEDSWFVANRAETHGGAVAALFASDPSFRLEARRTRFVGNVANSRGGAVYAEDFGLTLENCSFSGNAADLGGAVYEKGNEDALFHLLSVSNNTAGNLVGGIWAGRGTNVFRNSVLWGNRAGGDLDDQQLRSSGTVSVDHCCIEGWTGRYSGQGNLAVDPRFVDPDGADDALGTRDDLVKLAADSPCIDAGWNEALPDLDLFGLPRAVDDPETPDSGQGEAPLVDMGAYEFQGPLVRFPREAAPGDVITSHGYRGKPGGILLLAVVTVNGVPVFFPVQWSRFDDQGRYHREVVTPPGLAGVELELQLFGEAPQGGTFASNREPIRFR